MAPGHAELLLVARWRHHSPVQDRVGESRLDPLAVARQPALRLGASRPAPRQLIRRVEDLEAEHLAAVWRTHRRVERRRHVGEEHRIGRHTPGHRRGQGASQALETRQDECRRNQAVGFVEPVEGLGVGRRRCQDRVDFRFVTILARRRPDPAEALRQPRSFERDRRRIAGHDDGADLAHLPAGETHTRHSPRRGAPTAVQQHALHRRPAIDTSACGFEAAQDRIGESPAASGGTTHLHQVPHRMTDGAEAGAGGRSVETPHDRTGGQCREDQRLVAEELGQKGLRRAARPRPQAARGGRPAAQDPGHSGRARRLLRQFDEQLRDRSRGLDEAAVPVDLTGIGPAQPVEGYVQVVPLHPGAVAVPEPVDTHRIDIQVAEAEARQLELVRDGHGPHQRVVAVADVDPGADRLHGGGAAADGRAGLVQERPQAGAREVRRRDQPVVARAQDGDVGGSVQGHASKSARRSKTMSRSLSASTGAAAVRSSPSRTTTLPPTTT